MKINRTLYSYRFLKRTINQKKGTAAREMTQTNDNLTLWSLPGSDKIVLKQITVDVKSSTQSYQCP